MATTMTGQSKSGAVTMSVLAKNALSVSGGTKNASVARLLTEAGEWLLTEAGDFLATDISNFVPLAKS
jgi:hypothetical protein